MYKIAVMGDWDSIYGFAAVGLETVPVTESAEAARKLRKMAEDSYAVVYITEALASALGDELDRYKSDSRLAVVPIPGAKGNTGIGIANVKKSVEQAVGSDIIFNDKN